MNEFKNLLAQHYAIPFDDMRIELTGGYECDVWRVGYYVVRMCPAWRSEAELVWTYNFVESCAKSVPEVVAPIKTTSGETFIFHDDRAVLIFPFVEGEKLELSNKDLIWQSAQVLAKIHRASDYLPANSERPLSKRDAPQDQPDPKSIQDPDLDAWYNEFTAGELVMGMTHGDYYRGNILCKGNHIVGVIDWDECEYVPIINEIAWATWELCHTDSGDELDTMKAARFLYAYVQVYPQMIHEMKYIVPLIRYHLRYEIRRSIAYEQAGLAWDDAYRQSEIRAFKNLRKLIFTIF